MEGQVGAFGRYRKFATLAAAAAAVLGVMDAQAQQSDGLAAPAVDRLRQSIVYLTVDSYDPRNGRPNPRQVATGFIVSRAGHVLTAAHVLAHWGVQTGAHMAGKGGIKAWVGAPGLGATSDAVRYLDVIDDGRDGAFAILQFANAQGQSFSPLPVCADARWAPAAQARLRAFGFPHGGSLEGVAMIVTDTAYRWQGSGGHLRTQHPDRQLWAARGAAIFGMSGGPVLDAYDVAVGMVEGGFKSAKGVDPVRSVVTPLHLARDLGRRIPRMEQRCSAGLPWKESQIVEDCAMTTSDKVRPCETGLLPAGRKSLFVKWVLEWRSKAPGGEITDGPAGQLVMERRVVWRDALTGVETPILRLTDPPLPLPPWRGGPRDHPITWYGYKHAESIRLPDGAGSLGVLTGFTDCKSIPQGPAECMATVRVTVQNN